MGIFVVDLVAVLVVVVGGLIVLVVLAEGGVVGNGRVEGLAGRKGGFEGRATCCGLGFFEE